MRINLTIDSVHARRLLRKMAARGQKLPLDKIGMIGVASTRRNIAEGGRPTPWTPLSKNTIAGGRGKGKGTKPLRDTGLLSQSTFYLKHEPDNVQVLNTMPYAAAHQFGTKPRTIRPVRANMLRFFVHGRRGRDAQGRFTGRRSVRYAYEVRHPGIPARPFVIWQDSDISLIERMLLSHFMRGK